MHALRSIGIATAAVAAGLVLTTAPATADPASSTTKFADEGRAAGLNAGQIREVQRAVDQEVRVTGGRQAGLNTISLKGGEITVPVPGEKYARDLAASASRKVTVYESCRRGNFCGWKGRNGTGEIWQRGACGMFHEIPNGWNSGGSWRNYQSDGLVASFYGKGYTYLSDTPPAPTGIVNGDWHPVWYVWACDLVGP